MIHATIREIRCGKIPFKLLLFVVCICGSGYCTSIEITTDTPTDEDLKFWLDLYQEPKRFMDSKEIECLAQNIYFEARSESEQGQRAVGHVVMNRVAHKGYPNTICAVVKQGGEKRRFRCQFTWWCDGQSDEPVNQKAWQRSLELATSIYTGRSDDPTEGALWYHADYVNPEWSSTLVRGKKIGQHRFYLSKKRFLDDVNAPPSYALNKKKEHEALSRIPHIVPSLSCSDPCYLDELAAFTVIDIPIYQHIIRY